MEKYRLKLTVQQLSEDYFFIDEVTAQVSGRKSIKQDIEETFNTKKDKEEALLDALDNTSIINMLKEWCFTITHEPVDNDNSIVRAYIDSDNLDLLKLLGKKIVGLNDEFNIFSEDEIWIYEIDTDKIVYDFYDFKE